MNPFVIQSYIKEYHESRKTVNYLKTIGDYKKKEKTLSRIIELEKKNEIVDRGLELIDMSYLKEAVIECRLDGMNCNQIARHLGIDRHTVYRYIKEASHLISRAFAEGRAR